MRRCAALLAVLCAASGCERSRPGEQRAASAEAPGSGAPRISLTLSPAADQRSLDVELHARGPAVPNVRALRATRGWADVHPLAGVRALTVLDGKGAIEVGASSDEGSFSVLPLRRAPSGNELVVRYTVTVGAEASRFALHAGAGGLSAVGHAFVVRPALSGATPALVRLRAGSGGSLATSLEGRAQATVEDLADAVYVMGSLQVEARPSGERAVSAFGAGMSAGAALDLARGMVTKAAGLFDVKAAEEAGALQLFLIGERSIGKEHDGATLGPAVAVWIDATRALDAEAKVLLAHEALHRVFGKVLTVGEDGEPAAWFTEGFTTHYARKLLFDEGAIDAEAFAADVARADDERAQQAGADAMHAAGYGRGSRYAAMIDAAVRGKSGGKRGLDDVIRALSAEAKRGGWEMVGVRVFREMVAAEVGADAERGLWNEFVVGSPPEVPDGAYGPCFKRVVEEKAVAELGFERGSLAGPAPMIRGTAAGSAAAKAGVKDGALVLKSSLKEGDVIDPGVEVALELGLPGGKRTVKFKPAGRRKVVVFRPQDCKR